MVRALGVCRVSASRSMSPSRFLVVTAGDNSEPMRSTRRSVQLSCEECGGTFELSVSSAGRYRREGREPICRDCRRPELPEAKRAKLRAWWLKRYTRDELVELGRMLWPDAPGG